MSNIALSKKLVAPKKLSNRSIKSSRAILLCNLGSPDNCDETSVREYLNQFLMDPSVIQLPWLVRRLIVSLLVLPKRPKASAEAYQKIWTDKGSPLIVYSEQLKNAVQEKTQAPVHLAMRYGNPSIESQVLAIAKDKDIDEILFVPLYPHFADSTVTTSIIEIEKIIKECQLDLTLTVKKPFYNETPYINALVNSAKPYLLERKSNNKSNKQQPHLLFSYHGLPELHITKIDPSGSHCLKSKDCCSNFSTAHETCYRHQVFETTRLFIEQVNLSEEFNFSKEQYSVSFQSRLGKAKWLEPSTENTLEQLAKRGIKNVIVICPAFVTDCLETLEEIAIRGEQVFKQAGGNSLKLIPCLNTQTDWVNTVSDWL